MARFALVLVVVLAVAAGCGSQGDDQPSESEIPGGADPGDVSVIDEWVSRLHQGDVQGAAEMFALPSVAENGGAVIHIDDTGEARLFNASLPCGAVLVRAESEGDFTVATFRLTERPGPGTCGAGTGHLAQTAFVIEDGLIAEWRRVAQGVDEAPAAAA
jgi:hypothetical protein